MTNTSNVQKRTNCGCLKSPDVSIKARYIPLFFALDERKTVSLSKGDLPVCHLFRQPHVRFQV